MKAKQILNVAVATLLMFMVGGCGQTKVSDSEVKLAKHKNLKESLKNQLIRFKVLLLMFFQ